MDTALKEIQPPTLINNRGIRRIYVDRLFGQYTYELSDPTLPPGTSTRLILLYGDNGSGKTTILRILFFLLSHIDRKNHKTAVSKVRFKEFVVDFADGTSVIAQRKNEVDKPYVLRITKYGAALAEATYGEDESDDEPSKTNPRDFARRFERSLARDREHYKILQLLKELDLGAIYVTDDRRVLTTVPGLTEENDEARSRYVYMQRRNEEEEDPARTSLTRAVDQISSWATRRAFRGSAQGEEDVNSAYAAIMRRLAYAPQYTTKLSSLQLVIDALKDQGRRSPEFVRFGLIKPLRVDDIIEALRGADPSVRDTMLVVLEPYITGIKARLDALEPVRLQLSGFVDTMNSFYRNKTVHLDVEHGLSITTQTGDVLPPQLLSSGEGQLLYLLASTLVAKGQSNLLMLDEPEISLNVKWQRQLLGALLDLTADSNIQFVLATHSIELLTRYSEFVRDLDDTRK